MTYRKYHTINSAMNMQMVDQFREILNDKDCVNHVIYFYSNGGYTTCEEIICSMIKHYNHLQSGKRCVLVVCDLVASSAFHLIFKLPKSCVRYTGKVGGMIHKARVEVEITGDHKYYTEEDKAKKDFVVFTHNDDLKFFKKIGITDEEIKLVNKGKEVYLQHDRMIELFVKNGIKKFN